MDGKRAVREIIVTEGRYDKNTLLQAVDASVIETKGFGIFKNPELKGLLRRLAQARGVIILTDSDGAGFLIRNHLKGVLPKDSIKHAYIPDCYGKERRKQCKSAEGKLGVEGMPSEVLLACLTRAGATFLDAPEGGSAPGLALTKADLYEMGLSGTEGSAEKRKALQRKLNLPENLTANALLCVLETLYTRQELEDLITSPADAE